MSIFTVRPHAESYGHDVGILMLDCRTPFIPGDVGNATSYRYPVLYQTVPGLTLHRVIEEGNVRLADQVVEAARRLEAHGVRAITSDCGYMLWFQEHVAAAVSIPVMLSSLLQLPFIASLLNPRLSVGVICANRKRLPKHLLAMAYPDPQREIHIIGLEDKPNFRGPILDETPTLDPQAIETEVVEAALQLVDSHPDVGAILLECSNLPPYAAAISEATGRPVFDFLTMIDYVRAASRRTRYQGHY